MLESAKMILEFNVTLEAEAQPNPKDKDSDRGSLSFSEQQRLQIVSPRAKKKQTYRTIDGKTPVQTPD